FLNTVRSPGSVVAPLFRCSRTSAPGGSLAGELVSLPQAESTRNRKTRTPQTSFRDSATARFLLTAQHSRLPQAILRKGAHDALPTHVKRELPPSGGSAPLGLRYCIMWFLKDCLCRGCDENDRLTRWHELGVLGGVLPPG